MNSHKLSARYKQMQELDESVQEELKQLIDNEEYFDNLFTGLFDVAHTLEKAISSIEPEADEKEEANQAEKFEIEELVYSDDGEGAYDMLDMKSAKKFSSQKVSAERILYVIFGLLVQNTVREEEAEAAKARHDLISRIRQAPG